MAPKIQRGRLRLIESPARVPESDVAVPATASSPERVEPPASLRVPKGNRGALGDLPDAQLVTLGAEGNTQALEVLYRRHAAFAIHLATRIEGSPRDVEDIVHDAFLRAFERLRDLTDKAAFRGWLGSIVVHAVRSRMRRARLMNVLGLGRSSEPVDLDALASPEASPHVRAQLAQIYALLRTLSADDRIAWTLRYIEGHELEAVANLTRCSLATVKRRISRAQQFLDEHFVDPTTKEATVKSEVSS
ncbi:MAG: sigma-70 family RNA polymerase sigma factor [Polyangiaceae bacterium]|nr:sigma-70 family RNA polymerase sigma factor [Polyangiaceae bacterium]